MKLTRWVLAAALLVPSLAAADPMGRDRGRAHALERFDANRDGQLDDQERGAARAQRRARALQRFDANHDGRLDRGEKRQAKAARMQRRAQRFERLVQRFDRDGDGSLGPGELPPRAMKRMKKLDRDGDGWVRPDEMRRLPARDRAPDAAPPSQAPGAHDDEQQY